MKRRSQRRELRLQRLMVVAAVAMTALAVGASIALELGTDFAGRRAEELGVAAEHARLTETLRADLLDLSRTSNLVLSTHSPDREKERTEIQAKIYGEIADLRRTAIPAHRPVIDKVERDVRALETARRRAETRGSDERVVTEIVTAPLETALASLADLRRADANRMRDEETHISAWTRTADLIAWPVVILVVVLSAALAAGMYWILLRPLLDLSTAMKRFSQGDRSARAGSSCARELASAADNFNEMADIISGQHTRMLDFLGAVSKTLQKPLRAMRGSLAEVGPDKALQPEARTRHTLATLSQELERLDQLVLGFLDASRVEWQRLDLQQTSKDVRGLLTRIVQVYETFSPVHRLSLAVPEQPVCIRFDEGRMSQVLHTLLGNAIQYSPGGGVVNVVLATEPDATSHEQKRAVLSVTDHGVGIPPEHVGKIFEAFHNVQSERQPRPGAVALSVAKRIVEAHGGSMEVESQPGAGTTFRVRLPLVVEVEHEVHGMAERKRGEEKVPGALPHPEPSR
jgi:two-component system, OmpR family, sensor histidine kinase MtrB